jgi:hypothetical protein
LLPLSPHAAAVKVRTTTTASVTTDRDERLAPAEAGNVTS